MVMMAFACLCLTGCVTNIREKHYFKDNLQDLPNYYCVDVKAHTFLFSKTRYYSGFFKKDAIDTYFNEFSQPKDGKLRDSTHIQPVAGDPDRQLVVILSSNADEVATQIGGITQSKNTLKNLISLTNGGKEENLVNLKDETAIQLANNKTLVAIGGSLLKDLETKDSMQVQSTLLQLLNQLASDKGKTASFKNFSEAREWLLKQN